MRVILITAGAAGMYCGSCVRDNALAAELISSGQDVTLIPVYTPTRTDEPNFSRHRVLFGGLSVYLQHHFSVFRRTPCFLDRLWDFPYLINLLAGRSLSPDPSRLGALTISMLRGEQGVLGKEYRKLIDWVSQEPVPDIINLPNSLLIALAAPLGKVLQRPVCCTLQGEELFIEGLPKPFREQTIDLIRRQVRHVDRFIAVSEYSAGFMAEFLAIPSDRISVVPLGINMTGYQRRQPSATPENEFRIGFFARVAPEKGLRELTEAYIRFRRRTGQVRIRLEAAGYLAGHQRGYLNEVLAMLKNAGLAKEFSYRGELDREGKLAYLSSLDLLSVPATYDEPKGMFLLEAMASGVPVVEPRRGAFVEIVKKTGGGILVEPDDPDDLADAFFRLWQDRKAADNLAQCAFQGVRNHYTISQSATRLLKIYEEVLRYYAVAGSIHN